jgi:hypothetical protein
LATMHAANFAANAMAGLLYTVFSPTVAFSYVAACMAAAFVNLRGLPTPDRRWRS